MADLLAQRIETPDPVLAMAGCGNERVCSRVTLQCVVAVGPPGTGRE